MAHVVREFATGATRQDDADKPDYEGCLSPLVIERFGAYMLAQQETPDGVRASDNWQLGIPADAYMKSAWRHFLTWWKAHRAGTVDETALCALLFNTMGYLHEHLKTLRETPRP